MVIEIRAHLGGMTLSNIDALSRDEARRLSPQEVDPIDEEAQAPAPASPPAKPKAKPRSPRDPLVDTTPFGSEPAPVSAAASAERSEEHTSELQSLMRNSYAVFCLKKKTNIRLTKQSRNKKRQQKQ